MHRAITCHCDRGCTGLRSTASRGACCWRRSRVNAEPGRAAGQHPAPGRESGLVGLEPEHQPDQADGPGRRPDDVPLPRRLELRRLSLQCAADLQRRGDRREHGQLHRVGERRRAGHARLRLGQPARGGGVPGLPERPGRQHDGDRQRPGVERLDQCLADGQLADGRLLGQPARRRPAGAGRRPQLPPPQPPRPVRHPVLGGRQRGVRRLGDRPPHRRSTTRRPTSRSPSSSPPTPPRSRPGSRSASTSAAPEPTSTTGRPTSCSSRSPRASCRGS